MQEGIGGHLLWSLCCRWELGRPYTRHRPIWPCRHLSLWSAEFPQCLQKSFAFVDVLRRFRLQTFNNLRGRQRDTHSIAREPGLPGWLISRIAENTDMVALPTSFVTARGESIDQGSWRAMFLSSPTLGKGFCLHLSLLRKVPNRRQCLDGHTLYLSYLVSLCSKEWRIYRAGERPCKGVHARVVHTVIKSLS